MTTKHTPGPWAVDDDGDVCADDLERLVAAVDWRHVSLRDGEAAANAHLIAAAPELLAICSDLLEMDAAGMVCPQRLVALARMAVAKARGEP